MKSAKAVGMDTMIPKTRSHVTIATRPDGSKRPGVRFALNAMEKERWTSKNEWNSIKIYNILWTTENNLCKN
jgi:hypothetical protein